MKNIQNENMTYSTCSTCRMCHVEDIRGNVLCREKGIVSAGYSCSRYRQKPVPMFFSSLRMQNTFITCQSCSHYEKYESDLGFCHLYKTRPFDGAKRKVCTKYSANLEHKSIS